MQNGVRAQLESIYSGWQNLKNISEDLSSVLVEGFTKQNIEDVFLTLLQIVKVINEDESFEPDMLSLATVQSRLNALRQYVSSHLPSNPQAHLPGFISQLELLRSGLLEWADQAETRKQRISKTLIQRLGDANAKAEEIREIHTELQRLQGDLVNKLSEIDGLYQKVAEGESKFDASLEDTTTKTAEVARLNEKAKQDTDKLASLLLELSNLKGDVEEAQGKQDELFDEFTSYRDTIDQTLGDANRVSMAGAFITQRDKYNEPLESWNKLFILSIVVLICMAVWVVAPFMTSGRWFDFLIRLPLTAPAIWLAWFASKQHGHISKLREDYAYKAAAAMAFEGYKREAMTSTNPEMQSKLLDTAINQLGDNPIRVYQSQHSDHDSPWSEFIEKHFKDTKLVDAVTNLIKAVKG
jgi:hypothetical protein